MSSSSFPLYIGVFVSILVRGNGGRTVIIPETVSVIEHTPLQLHCSYKNSSELPVQTTCRWSTVENGTSRAIAYFYDNCLFRNYFEEIYNFECKNKTANSLIIKSTDRNLHGTVFSCSYFGNGINAIAYSTIHVIVPVSIINLTQPETDVVTTVQNKKVTFTCNASDAYPKPNIKWYSDSHTSLDYKDDVEITKNGTVLFDSDGYLFTVKSILTFYPEKFDNGSHIYCNARNIERQSISSTRKTLLNVQYPPSTPEFFTRSNVSIQNVAVIINNTLQIHCKSRGNPFPRYKWTTSQNKEVSGEDLSIENIKQTDDGMYNCMAYNSFTAVDDKTVHNTSASIQVTVLYPPDSPNLYNIRYGITEEIFSSTINVVKGDYLSVLCNSTGKPSPVSGWKGAESSDTLFLNFIEADTHYTCTSSNVMMETEGQTRNGSEYRKLKIHVLYPSRKPVVHIQVLDSTMAALNNTGILEGSDFRLYCHAVSNPPPSYKWAGPVTSNHMSTSAELSVSNIQRNQSGPFVCYAQNKMERSFGNSETGRNNQSIYFNILYKSTIKYFGAAEFENIKNIITVNQGEETQIICKVESNPFSNSTIFFRGRLVNETIRGDTVFYNLINTGCSDAGRYICKGKNEYNYEADASRDLFLYVKCLPQPSADQPPDKNVSAALSDSAVLRFYAAPYYDPGITKFRWFKQENDNRISLRDGTKVYILSSDIHSVLRINDLSETDYGMYILEYNNSVGMNNFTFYLQQKDQTVSEEIYKGRDKSYIPVVIGIVVAVLVIVGITLGIVMYIKRYKQKTHRSNRDRSYDDVCGMNTMSGGNKSVNCEPVYEGLKTFNERGYVEMKEQAYDILKPKDSVDTKDPVYTNLKL